MGALAAPPAIGVSTCLAPSGQANSAPHERMRVPGVTGVPPASTVWSLCHMGRRLMWPHAAAHACCDTCCHWGTPDTNDTNAALWSGPPPLRSGHVMISWPNQRPRTGAVRIRIRTGQHVSDRMISSLMHFSQPHLPAMTSAPHHLVGTAPLPSPWPPSSFLLHSTLRQ